jgi:hypothetical protein
MTMTDNQIRTRIAILEDTLADDLTDAELAEVEDEWNRLTDEAIRRDNQPVPD